MPTENEYKFVLSKEAVKDFFPASDCALIRQGYLTDNPEIIRSRIRETKRYFGEDALLPGSVSCWLEPSYIFNFKCDTYGTVEKDGRRIEIESEIDDRDFDDLWECTFNRVEKLRVKYLHRGIIWDVDFFGDHSETAPEMAKDPYFVMAEVELPEGDSPGFWWNLPEPIKKHLIYCVPLTENLKYGSNKFHNPQYAEHIYKTLLEDKQKKHPFN